MTRLPPFPRFTAKYMVGGKSVYIYSYSHASFPPRPPAPLPQLPAHGAPRRDGDVPMSRPEKTEVGYPFTPRTFADYGSDFGFSAHCRRCGRHKCITDADIERIGPDTDLDELRTRLRCKNCGGARCPDLQGLPRRNEGLQQKQSFLMTGGQASEFRGGVHGGAEGRMTAVTVSETPRLTRASPARCIGGRRSSPC